MKVVLLLVAALGTFASPGMSGFGQFVVMETTEDLTISIDGQPDETITTILAEPDVLGAHRFRQLRRGHVLAEAGTSIGI
jgi:hypothetical protein